MLEGMVFFGYHGVATEEKALGQRFVVDLEVGLDLLPAGQSDDLSQTVSYAVLFREVREIVEGPACDLLEAVAEKIGAKVLTHDAVDEVRVRIRKPAAPIKGSVLQSAGVEIVRTRG